MIHTNTSTKPGSLRLMVPQRPPRASANYTPIKHSTLLDEITRQVQGLGLRLTEWVVYVTPRTHRDMTAGTDIHSTNNNDTNTEGRIQALGVVNSNSAASAVKLYGGVVFIRDGVSVPLSEVRFAPHRSQFDKELSDHVKTTLAKIIEESKGWPRLLRKLRDTDLTYHQINEAILHQAKRKLIGYSQLGLIYSQIREGQSVDALSLVKLYAKAVQKIGPMLQCQSTYTLVKTLLA